MEKIPVRHRGAVLYALVDDEDYQRICAFGSWYIKSDSKNLRYVRCTITLGNRRRNVSLHRVVLSAANSKNRIDHINGDPLDNRKSNLRIVTPSQNAFNARKRPGTSKFKGVYVGRAGIEANISKSVRGQKFRICLGMFGSEAAAAVAYDLAAMTLAGAYAKTNFSWEHGGSFVFDQKPDLSTTSLQAIGETVLQKLNASGVLCAS